MNYNIEYPYYGKTYDNKYFVIIEPHYAVTVEHQGTYGFGFATYISRNKILKLFKYSHKITPQEFQKALSTHAFNFFKNIPGNQIVLKPIQNLKLIATKGKNNATD